MMRSYLTILVIVIFTSCNDEGAPGCFKTTGDILEYNIELEEFTSIDVRNNFNVTIEQGSVQRVKLTSGANLRGNISLEVMGDELIIQENSKCDWVRDYGNFNVHIVTPQLSQIRSSGGGVISSKGTLQFNNRLVLISELFTADFRLDVDLPGLVITNNDLSNYLITGEVSKLNVGFYAGDGRFDGSDLVAETVVVFQRGTNDMIVNATQSLTGEIRSTGNVIYCQEPPILDVQVIDDRGSLINSCN